MSTPSAKMMVLVGEKFACIKITGRANFSSSIDFRTLVNELLRKGYTCFVLDLSECSLMDSTFLGVLAGFGLKMGPKDQAGPGIELLNPNARITELLETLGVLHLFRLAQRASSAPESTEAQAYTPVTSTKEEVKQACLEAHQTLMEINPQNISRFKDVAQFLAEDLKRLKELPPEPADPKKLNGLSS
ncbi:MAG TPA: STAS domain-containing protein [Candidatus Binatia bacterium]|jgi:anti-sigma B factor antagonist|nr:STAS domain-containing protein [Candidatus Binatia bacterium]